MKFGLLLALALGASAAPAATEDQGGIHFGRAAMAHRPAAGTACANMHRLADGIQQNIAYQHQALDALARVKAAVSGGRGGTGDFAPAKAALLQAMAVEIQIREANQRIPNAPAAVVQGLQTVATKQAQELALSKSLGGTAADLKTISTLYNMFTAGITLNQQNAREVSRSPPTPSRTQEAPCWKGGGEAGNRLTRTRTRQTGSSGLPRQVARREQGTTGPLAITPFWLTRMRRDGRPWEQPFFLPVPVAVNKTRSQNFTMGRLSPLPLRDPRPRRRSWWSWWF